MPKRRELNVFNISFLDLLSGALGAVIILYIAVPKAQHKEEIKEAITSHSKIEQAKKKNDLDAKFNESEELKMKVSKLTERVKELEEANNSMKIQNEKMKKEISAKSEKDDAAKREIASIPVDVGFKFKGKNIVLIIDVSGSMFREDRIGQVKAGLKMLITSMSSDFNIDVIHFPNGNYSDYRPLWTSLKRMDQYHKGEIYGFLHGLRPFGSTPTRSVLEYALDRYDGATDIVILSDGAPTLSGSSQKDSIYDILEMVKRKNRGNIQISAIGVGSDFLKNTGNEKFVFLESLAKQNGGFFVGF